MSSDARTTRTGDSWFHTIFWPVPHLAATVVVHTGLVAGIALAAATPHWTLLIWVIAAIPYAIWYVVMVRAFNRSKGSVGHSTSSEPVVPAPTRDGGAPDT